MDREQLALTFVQQADHCDRLGSALSVHVLRAAAQDIAAGGPCWEFLEPFAGEPTQSLHVLRFLALFHWLAISGKLPHLAALYPTCGGTLDSEAAWRCILEEIQANGPELRGLLPRSVQTNEVARCCALAPGFVTVAEQTRLPLRLLEIGSSAGLNLLWDQYRYEFPDRACGALDSPVVLRGNFTKGAAWSVPVQIVERRGCDLNPVPHDAEGRLRLLSFIWGDQVQRFQTLQSALEVASRFSIQLDQADAVAWAKAQLSRPRPGTATVLFHSLVWFYLNDEARAALQSVIVSAGERATKEAPLAWLRMEGGKDGAETHLTLWPPGETALIATSDYHGRNVEVS